MATLKLTIYNLPDTSNMELDNSTLTSKYKFKVMVAEEVEKTPDPSTPSTPSTPSDSSGSSGSSDNTNGNGGNTVIVETLKEYTYQFSLTEINMVKQMYQPVEIIANIHIALYNDPNSTADDNLKWVAVSRSDIEKLFKHRQAKLEAGSDAVGSDFYVHEVIPEYRKDTMYVKLKIYSLDKMLTLRKTCRSFVGKQLGEILATELNNYYYPYDSKKGLGDDPSQSGADTQRGIHKMFSTANMQVLKYKGKTEGYVYNADGTIVQEDGKNKVDKVSVEHIFPYLVQYNESLYDMLVRTANRWGEFLYYQDGKIRFGYDSAADAKSVEGYNKITFPNTNTDDDLTKNDTKGRYDHQAAYDKTIDDSPVPTSPYLVRGEWGQMNGYGDKYAVKKVAQFLNHSKDLTSFVVDTLIDDGFSAAQAASSTAAYNSLQDDIYFSSTRQNKESVEKYGRYTFTKYDDKTEEKDGFNEFTEISSGYNEAKYRDILAKELKASNNMVVIDYDTTWPGMKLGDIVNVNGETFIVVDISIKTEDDKQLIKVTGIGRKSETDIFYPAVLPTGHVRYSGPQKAKIMDADDPTLKNRVRVAFPWQGDDKGDVSNVNVSEATPWLVFAAKGDGKPSTGRHNKGTDVLVGFIDNNIERPYVMGAIQDKVPYDTTIDVDCDTPGGHHMRLSDGCGTGLSSLLASALTPAVDTFFSFLPVGYMQGKTGFEGWDVGKRLEGGFTLSDYYGIYKISGSSDQRNITISSPWGDVKMNAFTGITISAPNGDVKISGKNVTIEAGNNLKLVSGANVGYKIFQDRKIKSSSVGTKFGAAGLTIPGAIAKRVLEKFQILDLTFLRCAVESVMRPIEGALTVKSNRYLKLEAGKNACEYPSMDYLDLPGKLETVAKLPVNQFAKWRGLPDLTVGQVASFWIIPGLVNAIEKKYVSLYNDCVNKKMLFDESINSLKKLSNDLQQEPCQTYDQLKNNFWSAAANAVEFDENTMAFQAAVGIDDVNNVDQQVVGRGGRNANSVLSSRRIRRECVMEKANELRQAIVSFLSFDVVKADVIALSPDISDEDADSIVDTVKRAGANNNQLFIYAAPTDEQKNLTNAVLSFDEAKRKYLKRAFALKLLKECGIITIDGDVGDAIVIGKPTDVNLPDHIVNDSGWKDYIKDLNKTGTKVLDLFSSWGLDIVGSFADTVVVNEVLNSVQPCIEQYAWSHGKDGGILLGANKQTYMLGEGDHPHFKLVKKGSSTDSNGSVIESIKDVVNLLLTF